MPDHVHFIIWICGKPELGGDFRSGKTIIESGVDCATGDYYGTKTVGAQHAAPAGRACSAPTIRGPKSGSLGAMVRSFKSETTRRIRAELEIGFGWQRSFYDHVIRTDDDLDVLRDYIRDNPTALELDD